jgi:hypothetical protein
MSARLRFLCFAAIMGAAAPAWAESLPRFDVDVLPGQCVNAQWSQQWAFWLPAQ